MGRYQEALADLDHALTLDKHSVYALVNRAKVYRITGYHQKALADLDRTIALVEKDRGLTTQQGETHQQALEDLDHAIPYDMDWY